ILGENHSASISEAPLQYAKKDTRRYNWRRSSSICFG
ncbi:hypothetical protein Csa_023820, partial [Cucumis sativus]